MLLVAAMLWVVVLATHGLERAELAALAAMAASGVIGIFIGDTALFAAMNRLGPRRTGVLFTTNAIFSALLGAAIFGERMLAQAVLGAALTLGGVMIATAFGQRRAETHIWETNQGHFGAGIALALLAALCQALGTLVAKPVMADALNPVTAAAVRTSAACGAHFLALWLGLAAAKPRARLTLRLLSQTAISGLIGMALGMTALLMALRRGDVGMVAILSSVTPVLILPLLWLRLGRPPAHGAWIGAALTVVGTVLILSR